MADLEERLRATIARRSEGFVASAELPDRIDARVQQRRRRRQLMTGGLVAAAAAAVVAIVVLATPDGHDEGSIQMTDQDRVEVNEPDQTSTTTTTTAPSTSTTEGRPTSTTSSSSTTASLPEGPTGPGIDLLTPLSRHGIGPITAGMTIRQAQEEAGVTITASGGGSGSCVEATIDGTDPPIVLLVEPAADLMNGIVRAVTGSVLATEEGAQIGQSRGELLASLGQPTRIDDESATYGAGAELLVFEAGGYAYGAFVMNDLVTGLQSGDPNWVNAGDGCP